MALAAAPCDGELPGQDRLLAVGTTVAADQPDLVISTLCVVKPGKQYLYGNINIIAGGTLVFEEAKPSDPNFGKNIEFWAKSIIIESGGAMLAGVPYTPDPAHPETIVTEPPFGTNQAELRIVLYGADKSPPIVVAGAFPKPGQPASSPICQSPAMSGNQVELADCGVPKTVWDTNGNDPNVTMPDGKTTDRFYQYGGAYLDGLPDGTGKVGHFSYKSIGLGWGGTLRLVGLKGTSLADDSRNDYSGSSWVRLAADVQPGATRLKLDRNVKGDWQAKQTDQGSGVLREGDEIVLTTTDYMPGHSEELRIVGFTADNEIQVERVDAPGQGVKYRHSGTSYDIGSALQAKGATAFKAAMDANDGASPKLSESADTRAAVALLRRSIRIMSGGDTAGETFDAATTRDANYQFGGQVIFRQGFKQLNIQGVEFHQLGVGGRFGHYPVHFHMARKVPADTYVKDSSVSESMTRWFVIHQTLGATLQRNVGWKSIGHGYFLETGVETDNKLFSNIGIYARAAIYGPDNPRNVPGIMAPSGGDDVMYRSDVVAPTVFWITNGWNDFVGNMAAGAGTCGACYWLHATNMNTDMVEMPADSMDHQNWDGLGYSARAGRLSPLRTFYRNYCSTAMLSFITVSNTPSACDMVAPATPDGTKDPWKMTPVPSYAPPPGPHPMGYYPNLTGTRNPTVCPAGDSSCTVEKAPECTHTGPTAALNCGITILDHYTTSFNFAQTNFAAVWLRSPGWYIYDHSFLSDVQSAGLSFVSGGDYTKSSAPSGFWTLASHSIFVGATQPQSGTAGYSAYADIRGPQLPGNGGNVSGGTACDFQPNGVRQARCISKDDGIGFFLDNWAPSERLFSIYDGPAYEDNNGFLDTNVAECDLNSKDCMYQWTLGVRKNKDGSKTYMPNAAIGWKQPNGFYYPPAFHSQNMFFSNVDIRHYVISPLFQRGTYLANMDALNKEFSTNGGVNTFTGFTDVDRETVLNDEDGSLTGFAGTLSINDDPFFGAPVQVAECLSNLGITPKLACAGQEQTTPTLPAARTSPYEYVTTVVFPECAQAGTDDTACGSSDTWMPYDTTANPPVPHAPMPGATRFTAAYQRGGDWSKDCGTPVCFGVPLYRQLLTSAPSGAGREWEKWVSLGCKDNQDQDSCDFPFLRMNGSATWQRDTLTVNNGIYYIDTTRAPLATSDGKGGRVRWGQHDDPALGIADKPDYSFVECSQRASGPCQPRSVNVFQPGQRYSVFFVFATGSLKQTYQMYVGTDATQKFNPATDVDAVLVGTDGVHFAINHHAMSEVPGVFDAHLIDAKTGSRSATGDVLEVVVDLSKLPTNWSVPDPNHDKANVNYSLDPTLKGRPETCRPRSFCGWGGTKPTPTGLTKAQSNECGCALTADDPLFSQNKTLLQTCAEVCNTWAAKQMDCPDPGCIGFSFKLPAGFAAVNQYKRPPVVPYKAWKTLFTRATAPAFDCTYNASNTPGDPAGQCGVPNIADLDGLPPVPPLQPPGAK